MGKFRDWLEFQIAPQKPGHVGGGTPAATASNVTRAVNHHVSRNPGFVGDVIGAPHPRDQAQVIGQATSDLLGGQLRNTPASADVVNRQFATSTGLDPARIFKLMKKKMNKRMKKQ